jgi:hypothetical protein
MALKPIPESFDPAMPIRKAMERHHVAKATVIRWRKRRGAVPKAQPDAWSERELYLLRTNFNSMTYAQLCEALPGRSALAIKARANGMGLKKASGNFARDRGPRFDGQHSKGIADMAAQHLRREAPVFRCDADGAPNPKGKCWRYGNAVLTEAEMIAKAERKGWKPDEWKTITDPTVTIGKAANRVLNKLRGKM